jgi:hypothetical protein
MLRTARQPETAMKILVVHDEYGNLKSAAIAADEPGRRAGLRTQRGEFVTEVEEATVDPQELRRSPRDFCANHRIDPVSGRLVRKNR